MVRSNLTLLEQSASRFPSNPVFKTPRVDSLSGQVQEWVSVTYSQFHNDVQRVAQYWTDIFKADGISQRSVIGVWVGGFSYSDLLHIYGISRAGYIPQLFSLRLPNPEVIYELLHRANAKALVFESSFEASLANAPVSTHLAISADKIRPSKELVPSMPEVCEDDIAFIFHTSGSTSGSPKLVPCSYRWLGSAIDKSRQISKPSRSDRQDVTVWMGSMCHIGQTFMLLGSLQFGSCVIQPTVIAFSSEELADMIHRCGLNRLNQFPTFLANHLRASKVNKDLLSMLTNLDEVLYSGLPLAREEEEWAFKNGIKLRNVFGSTEVGAMLMSVGGTGREAPLLRPLEGVAYEFRPIGPQTEGAHLSTARMFELVILKGSADVPAASLRHNSGDFYTGDLFQEVVPGSYVFRGRDDDWIKSENSLRCDTKAIEDNVRAMCGNLIAECIVVGSGRPSPALFIEPACDTDHERLKKEIIRKTRQFHSRRYLHERITSPNMIIIVPSMTLPRTATKGNIRRKAVEDAYKTQLDQLYGLRQ